jgi:excisionase family DNA binding protein
MNVPVAAERDRDVVTVAEAGRRLSVSYSTVQRLIYAGELDTLRVGSRGVRVLVRSIDAYIDREAERERALRTG